MAPFTDFALQFNKNSFGLTLAEPLTVSAPLAPSASVDCKIKLTTTGQIQKTNPINTLQVAIKNNAGVSFWSCLLPLHIFFVSSGKMEANTFIQTWTEIPATHEKSYQLSKTWSDSNLIKNKLQNNNIFLINSRNVENTEMNYFSMELTNKLWILLDQQAFVWGLI